MEYETDAMTSAKISKETRQRLHAWKRFLAVEFCCDLLIDDVIAAGLDALAQKYPTVESQPHPELA